MRFPVRRVAAATFAVGTALTLTALPALASAPKPDPYLVADTQMTNAASIAGGGSTFAGPLQNAAEAYYQARNANATLAGYQLVGSGAGEVGILANTFNWGGTDVPMAQSDINSSEPAGKTYTVSQFLQVPIGLGGVAISYNLPGFNNKIHLDLNAKVIADIYLGKITKWNDPAIKALNKKYAAKLPNHAIDYVARADKSGTTYIFTNFLGTAAPTTWTTAPSKSPLTLVNSGDLAGTGNPGVASDIAHNKYTIGYVEYSYVLLNPALANGVAAILNKSGDYVLPSVPTVAADAAAKPNVSATSLQTYSIVFEPTKGGKKAKAQAYPIAGYTWAIVWAKQTNNDQGTLLVKYLDWLSHSFPSTIHLIAGQNIAGQQGYVPLPANIQHLARVTLLKVRGTSNQVLLTTHG
jgi:phosphate transport system substrate-binding protein